MPTCRMDTGRALSKLPFTSRSGMGAQHRAPASKASQRQAAESRLFLVATNRVHSREKMHIKGCYITVVGYLMETRSGRYSQVPARD